MNRLNPLGDSDLTSEMPAVVLRPKKSSAIWLLVGCTIFVAGGVWLAQKEGWVGYLCAGFFALGIPVAVVQLLPGGTYLRIAEDGITFANLFRVTTIPWEAIDRFSVLTIENMAVIEMVGIDFVPSYDQSRLGRRISSRLVGCEGALPDTYGKEAPELAEILNRCLAQFKSRGGAYVDQE